MIEVNRCVGLPGGLDPIMVSSLPEQGDYYVVFPWGMRVIIDKASRALWITANQCLIWQKAVVLQEVLCYKKSFNGASRTGSSGLLVLSVISSEKLVTECAGKMNRYSSSVLIVDTR
jgi:hypothetical protein